VGEIDISLIDYYYSFEVWVFEDTLDDVQGD
jgi:hypothetical protein